MVLGCLVGSMVLVPLLISFSSSRMLHVPSEPLTTVIFLASASIALLPSTSRATTCHVPSYCLRSFLIAVSLASSAEAIVPIIVSKAPATRSPKNELLMIDLQQASAYPSRKVCNPLLVGGSGIHFTRVNEDAE